MDVGFGSIPLPCGLTWKRHLEWDIFTAKLWDEAIVIPIIPFIGSGPADTTAPSTGNVELERIAPSACLELALDPEKDENKGCVKIIFEGFADEESDIEVRRALLA